MEHNVPITVNGRSQQLSLPSETAFIEVMKAVNRAAAHPGHSLIRVQLNGEDITGMDWQGLAAIKAGDIQSLAVETGDLAALARATVESLDDYIGDVSAGLRRAAQLFRQGDDSRGLEIYSEAVSGLFVVHRTLALVQRHLGIDPETTLHRGQSLSRRQARLEAILSDMLTSQEERDTILLADLIEYELVPHLQETQEIITNWNNEAE